MTAGLPRMDEEQSSKARKLIQRLCANYDRGCCLLLDDGYDPCPCPQMISSTLLCRYFRAAVLPVDRELWAEVMGVAVRRYCTICGKPTYRCSNATKYCLDCAARERRRKDAARKREKRLNVRKSGV